MILVAYIIACSSLSYVFIVSSLGDQASFYSNLLTKEDVERIFGYHDSNMLTGMPDKADMSGATQALNKNKPHSVDSNMEKMEATTTENKVDGQVPSQREDTNYWMAVNEGLEPATKLDGSILRSNIDGLISRMERNIDGLISRTEIKMDGLISSMKSNMGGLTSRMESRMDGLISRMENRMDGLISRLENKLVSLTDRGCDFDLLHTFR